MKNEDQRLRVGAPVPPHCTHPFSELVHILTRGEKKQKNLSVKLINLLNPPILAFSSSISHQPARIFCLPCPTCSAQRALRLPETENDEKKRKEKTCRSSQSACFTDRPGGRRAVAALTVHTEVPTLPLRSSQFQTAAAGFVCVFLRLLLRARRLVPAVRCGLDSSACAHTRPCARGRCTHARTQSRLRTCSCCSCCLVFAGFLTVNRLDPRDIPAVCQTLRLQQVPNIYHTNTLKASSSSSIGIFLTCRISALCFNVRIARWV